ncbi:MAG: MBOAT family O-acyltransferase [Verrucomicrobiaceae bacterium]
MLFNSYQFWAFFALVILIYRFLGHRAQNHFLLFASYLFYACWDWRFLGLILLTTAIHFVAALKIAQAPPASQKRWLIFGVASSLGILALFKYANFFLESTSSLLQTLGFQPHLGTLAIILPVGISFYTFQTLSYTIDVLRKETTPTRSFFDFALYVAYFPQLVAGPIERSSHLLPQITQPRKHNADDFTIGLSLVLVGLFLKVAVADNLAFVANGVFLAPADQLTGTDALAGLYAFAFQIYGDFAGYSFIACGISRWLGIRLMTNFRRPYLAQSPSDFWNRWHISLSSWLRDYLYIPLGGNRQGTSKTYRNLMLTMLLGGLWHGAAWTFVIWGLLHGLILCLYRLGSPRLKIPRLFATLLFFHLVCLTWLFFRADSLAQATSLLLKIFFEQQLSPFSSYAFGSLAFFCLPLVLAEIWSDRHDHRRLHHLPWLTRALVYCYLVWMIISCAPVVHSDFIYFQF